MTGSKEEKQDYQVMAEELLLKVPRQGMSSKNTRKTSNIFGLRERFLFFSPAIVQSFWLLFI